MKKAFFLDRDGVININKGHIVSTNSITLFPGMEKALKYIKDKDYIVIMITNQSSIGRGLINESQLHKINEYLISKISKNNTYIDDVYFCPHHPKYGIGKYKINCACRKPNNKLIEDAISKWNIVRSKSFMIGDNLSDYKAAKRSKIKFFFKKNVNFYMQVKSIIS
jgi:D,D-heptose 1,7-bisphosphate phosphatase